MRILKLCLRCLRNECLNRLKHAKVVEDYQIKSVRQDYSVNHSDNTREIIINMINQLPGEAENGDASERH